MFRPSRLRWLYKLHFFAHDNCKLPTCVSRLPHQWLPEGHTCTILLVPRIYKKTPQSLLPSSLITSVGRAAISCEWGALTSCGSVTKTSVEQKPTSATHVSSAFLQKSAIRYTHTSSMATSKYTPATKRIGVESGSQNFTYCKPVAKFTPRPHSSFTAQRHSVSNSSTKSKISSTV